MKATLRSWSTGVVPSIEMEFVVPPVAGDLVEVVEYATFIVRSRRFAPDGSLWLMVDPFDGVETHDEVWAAFDEARSA